MKLAGQRPNWVDLTQRQSWDEVEVYQALSTRSTLSSDLSIWFFREAETVQRDPARPPGSLHWEASRIADTSPMEIACACTSKTAFKPGNQNYVSSGRPWDGQAVPGASSRRESRAQSRRPSGKVSSYSRSPQGRRHLCPGDWPQDCRGWRRRPCGHSRAGIVPGRWDLFFFWEVRSSLVAL